MQCWVGVSKCYMVFFQSSDTLGCIPHLPVQPIFLLPHLPIHQGSKHFCHPWTVPGSWASYPSQLKYRSPCSLKLYKDQSSSASTFPSHFNCLYTQPQTYIAWLKATGFPHPSYENTHDSSKYSRLFHLVGKAELQVKLKIVTNKSIEEFCTDVFKQGHHRLLKWAV